MNDETLAPLFHDLRFTFRQAIIGSLYNSEWYRFCFLYILFGYSNDLNIQICFNGAIDCWSHFIILV
ncbi:hypothetical protein D3C78_1456070 [compost metagenome]